MPCQSGPLYNDLESDLRRNIAEQKKIELALKQKISRLEALLCASSRVLARLEYDFDENPELSEWWDRHQKQDNRRKAKERKAEQQAKREAWVLAQANMLIDKPLSQLNDDEKSLLKEAKIL